MLVSAGIPEGIGTGPLVGGPPTGMPDCGVLGAGACSVTGLVDGGTTGARVGLGVGGLSISTVGLAFGLRLG